MCYQSRLDLLGDAGLKESVESIADVLRQIFMALDLGSERAGQFFTPYEVSLLMAKMVTVGDGKEIRDRGFITMDEPACGSGGMVVAVAQAMHEAGLNYPTLLHATCTDIDPTCVHMAYVQLSLLGTPATVVHGNSLTLESRDVWHTPADVLCGSQTPSSADVSTKRARQ
ncbi:N-6 DNA Methylase [Caballeronia terrestris]|uniref:site-specific DNA-methyltransferase (adenine-specific) n=1 Tax=Caballeronia terrestris TaxID=1226301 RepID=A0A158L116_9BURK|nr:N-6 DNA methylase [Caballeronia terrestris]SAL86663.1 N-6 DNA Methylase [Caballeronia terrestris]